MAETAMTLKQVYKAPKFNTGTGGLNPYNEDFYDKMKSAYYGATTPGIAQTMKDIDPQIRARMVGLGAGMAGTPYGGALSKEYGKLESQRQSGWQSMLGNLMGKQAGYEEQLPWKTADYTGYFPSGQTTFQREAYEKEFPLKEAQTTGYYGNRPTSQYAQQLLPWITQGYLPKDFLGGGYGGVQTERDLDPAWETSRKLGTENPFLTSLLGETDPDKLKNLIRDYFNLYKGKNPGTPVSGERGYFTGSEDFPRPRDDYTG